MTENKTSVENFEYQNLLKTSDGILMTFNTSAYDLSIDFIKGLCILFVVWTHCFGDKLLNLSFFNLWGHPAVPIFLLIQVFHAYKKGVDNVKKVSIKKLWDRIIMPFAILMAVIFLIKLAFSPKSSIEIIKGGILAGGFGPGSYYPYIYVEFALLLPLLVPLFQKIKNTITLGAVFIVASLGLEIICNLVNMPVWLYRLLCFRYIFIVYFGWLLVEKSLKINKLTIVLSFLSAMVILYVRFAGCQFLHFPESIRNILISFFNRDFTPFVYPAWQQAHWFNYFWDCYLYLFFILLLYKFVSKYERISSLIQQMGKYSYEIFLSQMFYFSISRKVYDVIKLVIDNKILAKGSYIICSTIVCIGVVLIWKKFREKKQSHIPIS